MSGAIIRFSFKPRLADPAQLRRASNQPARHVWEDCKNWKSRQLPSKPAFGPNHEKGTESERWMGVWGDVGPFPPVRLVRHCSPSPSPHFASMAASFQLLISRLSALCGFTFIPRPQFGPAHMYLHLWVRVSVCAALSTICGERSRGRGRAEELN